MNNEIIEIQKLLRKQMHRLDESCTRNEIKLETARSGALSQNAGAYLKAVSTSLRVKEMVKNNPDAENTILKEIGVLNEK